MSAFLKILADSENVTSELNPEFETITREKFFGFCERAGLEIDPEGAYAKVAKFAAQVIARFCPEIYSPTYDSRRYAGPRRGIILYGEAGRGKTVLARALYGYLTNVFTSYQRARKVKPLAGLAFIYEIEFSLNLAAKGPAYLNEGILDHRRNIYFFDDLGNERTANVYGNHISAEDVIRYRDVCLQDLGIPSVFTTNLGLATVKERYGEFNYSRVFGGYDGIALDYPVDRRING